MFLDILYSFETFFKPSRSQITALGAAMAAGSALGVWTLGTKMKGITVYK
jgi:glycerol kinase